MAKMSFIVHKKFKKFLNKKLLTDKISRFSCMFFNLTHAIWDPHACASVGSVGHFVDRPVREPFLCSKCTEVTQQKPESYQALVLCKKALKLYSHFV